MQKKYNICIIYKIYWNLKKNNFVFFSLTITVAIFLYYEIYQFTTTVYSVGRFNTIDVL